MWRIDAVGIVIALFVAGCGGPEPSLRSVAEPIIGGTIDYGDPAVVSIVNIGPSGYGCSGVVIDYATVLTAAHCLQDQTVSDYEVVGGTSVSAASWIAKVSLVAADSRWHTAGDPYDFGMVIVDTSQPLQGAGSLPAPMAWLASNGSPDYIIGTQFEQIGYGVTSGYSSDYGTKREVAESIFAYDVNSFQYGSSTSGMCFGDSGGPAIETINGVPTVIGVASYVNDIHCANNSVDMRTDSDAFFIDHYLGTVAQPSPTATPTPFPSPDPSGTPLPSVHHARGGGCDVTGL